VSVVCLDQAAAIGIGVCRIDRIDLFKPACGKEDKDYIQKKSRQQERPERQARGNFFNPGR
jgi:hypothetical protein